MVRVWCLGFQSLGFRVWGSGFRVGVCVLWVPPQPNKNALASACSLAPTTPTALLLMRVQGSRPPPQGRLACFLPFFAVLHTLTTYHSKTRPTADMDWCRVVGLRRPLDDQPPLARCQGCSKSCHIPRGVQPGQSAALMSHQPRSQPALSLGLGLYGLWGFVLLGLWANPEPATPSAKSEDPEEASKEQLDSEGILHGVGGWKY